MSKPLIIGGFFISTFPKIAIFSAGNTLICQLFASFFPKKPRQNRIIKA